MLTEPLKGDLLLGDSEQASVSQESEDISYTPRAHVQFLEQVGVRVVPLSYLDDKEAILDMLRQVNGVYLPGDSQVAITHPKYRQTFQAIVDYVEETNQANEDYFPMFLMGKSAQQFVQRNSVMQNTLQDMKNW